MWSGVATRTGRCLLRSSISRYVGVASWLSEDDELELSMRRRRLGLGRDQSQRKDRRSGSTELDALFEALDVDVEMVETLSA